MNDLRVTTDALPEGTHLPLSYPQRWMWVASKLAGAACNLPLALRLSGALDRSAIELAIHDLIEYHPILRTIYGETRGVPFQRVLDAAPPAPALAIRAILESELDEELALATRREFDLTAEIPLTWQLFELAPHEHVLLLNIHHIAVDQWSLGLLTRDFSLAYSARQRGERHAFPPLPKQYADYSLCQARAFGRDRTAGDGERQIAFWREALANMPRQIALPAVRPRPRVPTYRAGAVPIRLGADVHARLMASGRESRASLFMIVHAAVAAALSSIGAGTDVPICTPITGRADVAWENVVGLFLNTLILRTDASGDPRVKDLVARVRSADLDAYEHQDVPYELVLRSCARERGTAGLPPIQVCLIVNDGPGPAFALAGASVGRQPIAGRVVMFDLLFDMHARRQGGAPAGIEGRLVYSADLFDEAEVRPIADRVVRLLRAAAEQPDAPLSAVLGACTVASEVSTAAIV